MLKRAGVTDLVSLSACGSFKEDMPPGTFVLVDQFVDRTHKRESSFFGKGLRGARIDGASGVAAALRQRIWRSCRQGEGIKRCARRHLCLHGRSAVLHVTPRASPYKTARLFGDRHDQHAGGQARP